MSDVNSPKVKRISLDEPSELAALIRSGAIWTLPQYWQIAMDAIRDGLVPLAECRDLPHAVAEALHR